MPRRNRNSAGYRQPPPRRRDPEPPAPSYEQLARDLVERGLCPAVVLEVRGRVNHDAEGDGKFTMSDSP